MLLKKLKVGITSACIGRQIFIVYNYYGEINISTNL